MGASYIYKTLEHIFLTSKNRDTDEHKINDELLSYFLNIILIEQKYEIFFIDNFIKNAFKDKRYKTAYDAFMKGKLDKNLILQRENLQNRAIYMASERNHVNIITTFVRHNKFSQCQDATIG